MRNYYRCADCLSVMVLETREMSLVCACGGKVDWIGEVRKSRLTSTRLVPVCDGRCTNAVGPNCNCTCGGVNHGSHAVVAVVRDEGPVPKVTPPDLEASQERAEEYRKALHIAEEYLALSFGEDWKQWKEGAWIKDRNLWSQMSWWDYKLSQIRKLKRHDDRIHRLSELVMSPINPVNS